MYLARNASGQLHYPPRTNHFSPSAVIFDKRHYRQVLASDLGIVLLFGALGAWTYTRGFAEVATYYLVPYRAVPPLRSLCALYSKADRAALSRLPVWMNHWRQSPPPLLTLRALPRLTSLPCHAPPVVSITFLQHTDPLVPHYS